MKRVALLLTVVAVFAMMITPGHAAEGGGSVQGTVTVSPGLLVTPATVQTFNFAPIILTGTFAAGANNSIAYEGQITTSIVTGGSNPPGETLVSGAGYVNSFTFGKTGAGAGNISGTCNNYSGNAARAGVFSRTVGIVIVTLNCSATITNAQGAQATFSNERIEVIAEFSPTTGNGVTQPVTQASFSGEYRIL